MNKATDRFLQHLFHLTFLKGFARFLPLITIPFLIRTIGLEKLGTIKWVEAMADYFLLFIGYGFRYTATQQIASYPRNKQLLGRLIGSVYTIKLVAMLLCGALSWLLVALVPPLQALKAYWWTYYIVIVVSMLYPCFILQGLDQMFWMTGINLVSKILFLITILWCIHEPADALLYHQCLAMAYLLRLIMAWCVLYYKLGITILLPTWSIILYQLRAGFYIFCGQLMTNFYCRLPEIFLGFWGGAWSVGVYVLGSKVVYTMTSMVEPFTQALYPIAYQKWQMGIAIGLPFIKKIAWISFGLLASIGLLYGYWAENIIQLLADNPIFEAVQVLRLYTWLPCINLITNIVGISVLVPLKAPRRYVVTIFMASLVCMCLHILWVPKWQILGAACSMLVTEVFAIILMIFWAYRKIRSLGKGSLDILP
jgi:PST family polysaccharide transporter